MTLPIERFRSIIYARDFLRDLLDPKKTPGVPKAVRKEAYWRLRHFPADYEIEKYWKDTQVPLKEKKQYTNPRMCDCGSLAYGDTCTDKECNNGQTG